MLDFNKPVRTREGTPARILASDLGGEIYSAFRNKMIAAPLAVLLEKEGGGELRRYTAEGEPVDGIGRHYAANGAQLDLINVPKRTTGYVNLGESYTMAKRAGEKHPGFEVLEVVREGDTVVSTRIIPALGK